MNQLCATKDGSIGESGRWVEGKWEWEFKWRREPFERERGAISALTDFISVTAPCTGKADGWNWKASKDGEYSTKSAYITIAAARNEPPSSIVPTELLESVLKTPSPHKARVNAWRCLRKRLATCDNLVKRHVAMTVEELLCNCCVSREETTDHLFVLCPNVEKIWDEIQKWISTHAARPQNIVQHFNWFTHIGRDKKSGKLLKMI
ncbi:uncharacterized protein LOC131018188 [Salvia miltiorrhiza]|uniref:uncharacterized protein LOC131018188 n=1 Tax=Salvia miltiorrhiza TaxID=226208 RepID=UPI0025ABFB2C|nr:uncharacterized protein LOC131018188 [Salvia miltiorrhiza]